MPQLLPTGDLAVVDDGGGLGRAEPFEVRPALGEGDGLTTVTTRTREPRLRMRSTGPWDSRPSGDLSGSEFVLSKG